MKTPVVFVILQTGARANGGLQSITEVMCRLREHRPIVLTNLESSFAKHWRKAGIDVTIVPEQASEGFRRKPLGTLRTYRRYQRALKRILAEAGAQVVHANDPMAFQLSVASAKAAGARILLNLRDTLDPGRRPPRLKYRSLFAAADHLLFLSREMAESWATVAPNARRSFSVTYSIVDPDRFTPSLPPAAEAPVVLVPGIFWPKKGQLEFIRRVVPALAERGIESWFAGDFEPALNGYAAECAAAAEPYADRVAFLGFRNDLPDLYHRCSVVAVPSRHEGLMRGMVEAMSCGRPVVSFDVCSAREVLEDHSGPAGAVVEQGDYAAMARALVRFATDREEQLAAGQAGSAVARSLFDPAEVVERYERAYRELGNR